MVADVRAKALWPIRTEAGRLPAQEIADDRGLLDAGTITKDEYDTLKAAALA